MRLSIPHLVRAALLVGAAAFAISACGGSDDETSASKGGGGGIVSVANVDGTKVLADSAGRTLYSSDVERGGMIKCVDACLSFWKPVGASGAQARTAAAELGSKFGVVKRPDGS